MSAPRCLDLFCGRGGWTRGFLDAGYEVTGIDILPRHPMYPAEATYIQADLMGYDAGTGWDVIVASPPCTEFSQLTALRVYHPGGLPRDPQKGMTLVYVTHRIIQQAKPQYWAIENVRGARKWFHPLLGVPRFQNGPWCLWGDFPHFLLRNSAPMRKGLAARSKKPAPSGLPNNASWRRAYIPYDIARGLAEACKP